MGTRVVVINACIWANVTISFFKRGYRHNVFLCVFFTNIDNAITHYLTPPHYDS